MIEAGEVTPVISSVVQLADVPEAIRDLAAGRVQGKVVITP
jgi:NADPH:quinone reductase-like Zn-dependent oxidoreductase